MGSLAVLLGIFGFFGSSAFADCKSDCGQDFACLSACTTSSNLNSVSPTTTTTAPGYGTVGKTANPTGSVAGWLNNKCNTGTEITDINWKCIEKPGAGVDPSKQCTSDQQWNGKICENCSADWVCCGIKLNTDVPFIGRCIRLWSTASSDDTTVVTEVTAFPRLMWGLTKILTTLILLACFGGILAGGVMIASSGGKEANATKGKELIKNVVIAIALLWTSGIILKLINPNFFW